MTVNDPTDGPSESESVNRVSIRWHQTTDNDQLVLALEGDDVNLAVAFQKDASPRQLERVLDESQRELRYYLGTDSKNGRSRR